MSLPTVKSSVPVAPFQGAQPILEGEGELRWAQKRFQAVVNSVSSLIQVAVSNSLVAPQNPSDGLIKLSRYPWWPVVGQSADNWVYWDQAGALWRFLSTAPTTTH